MVQFGLRAHDFGKQPAQQLAEQLSVCQIASIQLALAKAITDSPATTGEMSCGYARRIGSIFAKRQIAISVLGCYINPVHPDKDLRELSLRRFEEHLRFARDFGCAIVGTETGSCNADCSFHPDTSNEKTFELFLRSIERLIKTAEAYGTIIGIEPVAGQHTIDSVEKLARVFSILDSPNLQTIYDPVNLLPWDPLPEPDNTILAHPSSKAQQLFFDHAFDVLNERIVAIHLKDFTYMNGHKQGNLCALTGWMDTPLFLKTLIRRKPYIDVLLENTHPSLVTSTLEKLKRIVLEIS